jgi:hypothetical protein
MSSFQWKNTDKERAPAFRDVRSGNPLRFVGNTWDPATPLTSAKNNSERFVDIAVLDEGVLPQPDPVCETSPSPFFDKA